MISKFPSVIEKNIKKKKEKEKRESGWRTQATRWDEYTIDCGL
jgi:hypothetical protein